MTGTAVIDDAGIATANITTANSTTANVTNLSSTTVPAGNTLSFGAQSRQMLNLHGTIYAIGVQSRTLYQRSNEQFAWYRGGVHDGAALDPGGGSDRGAVQMLSSASSAWRVSRSTRAPRADRVYASACSLTRVSMSASLPSLS